MEQPKSKDAQKELEIALAELEERVDRLRASYEQYFMGYEKIEPGVQRKDVDRRFSALRKQQIRNTALRFRFNVITQKFNTYAMYWTRICRQIEEGTFKRHVAKAAKRFGTPAAQDKRERDQDWSIDVEIGDFEDVDMEAILAEADAAAEAYGRGGRPADTVPPGATTEPPPAARLPASMRGTSIATPGTSFAMSGGRETVGSEPPSSQRTPAPASVPGQRAARPVALPPGAKQPVLVRRRGDGEAPPPSSPSVRAAVGSTPDRAGPPSAPAVRASPAAPAGGRPGPPVPSPAAASAGRTAAAPSSARAAPSSAAGGPSSARLPAAASSAGVGASSARIPVTASSAGAGGPSSGRLPAAAASSGARVPGAAPPPARVPPGAPAASLGRSPAAAPVPGSPAPTSPQGAPRLQAYRPAALPPSANRIPVAQGSAQRTPASPMAPPAPPEAARPPGSPASAPRVPAPASRPESADARAEREKPPASDRRPPLPLPSQVKKDG